MIFKAIVESLSQDSGLERLRRRIRLWIKWALLK